MDQQPINRAAIQAASNVEIRRADIRADIGDLIFLSSCG